jgi:hypothetical protein
MRRFSVYFLLFACAAVARADGDTPWGSPMTGPFSSPEELCGAVKICGEGTRAQGACGMPSVRGVLAPGGLLDDLRVQTVDCRFPDAKSGYVVPRLIAKTRAGWFATDPFARAIHEQSGCTERISVVERAFRDVDGAAGEEITVRLRVETTCGQGKGAARQTSESLVVIAPADGSGTPRATPPVLLKSEVKPRGGSPTTAQLEARFEGGALVVEPVTTDQTPETRATIGRHPLTLRGSPTPVRR